MNEGDVAMKKFTKHAFPIGLIFFVLVITFHLTVMPTASPRAVCAEEPAAEQPAERAEEPAKGEDHDWKIGEELDGETLTKIITAAAAAAQQKGSFWRNPALWEVVMTILLVVLGSVAGYFGWKKKKWGKIIQAVEKGVNTVYVEFVREAKLRNKDHKLSKEEMLKAIETAWNMTKADLLAQSIDLAKWIAREYFPVVVDKILKAVKSK